VETRPRVLVSKRWLPNIPSSLLPLEKREVEWVAEALHQASDRIRKSRDREAVLREVGVSSVVKGMSVEAMPVVSDYCTRVAYLQAPSQLNQYLAFLLEKGRVPLASRGGASQGIHHEQHICEASQH
jgi:hypothetical protein